MRTLARVHSGWIIPKISAAVSFLRQILRGEVGVLVVIGVVFLVVQATIIQSNNNPENPELSFYSIPSGKSKESKELRKRWLNLISRRDFSPTIGHRVCSLHFPGKRKTYLNQLPTIVPKATRPTPTNPRSTVKARNRAPLVSNLKSVPAKRRLFDELDGNNNLSGSIQEPNQMVTSVNENIDPIAYLQEQVAKLSATNEKLKEENESLKHENKCQKDKIRGLTEQLKEVDRKHFSTECFKDNDILIRFYTGLEDYKTFKTLFDSFGPAVSNLVYYGTKTDLERLCSEDTVKHGPKRNNSPEQEFFLVLVRLRLGLLEEDMATRAGLSQSHMSRIFIAWVDFLHSKLRSYPIWPSRGAIDQSMPVSFKDMYPSTQVVIDCTEIFIEKPNSFRSQCDILHSQKPQYCQGFSWHKPIRNSHFCIRSVCRKIK